MKCELELQKNVLLILTDVSTLAGWTATQCGHYLGFLSSMFPAHLTITSVTPKSVISLLIRSFLSIVFQSAVSLNLK